VNVVASRNLSDRLAAFYAVLSFLPLVRCELEWSAETLAARFGARAPFACSGSNKLTLKLRKAT
jgi:hypothetical protein